ncbi:MAG: hypothetical protein AB1758_36340 [Candidatus Eremiobacterota bacterium]
MANEYRRLEDRVSGDVHKASIAANVTVNERAQRVRLRGSDLPSMIPPGALIEVEPVVFHKLKFGTVVYVKLGNELALRRFVRLEIINDNDVLVLAKEKARRVDRIPANALVGRVAAAEFQGRPVRIRHYGSIIDAWTDFGTTDPITKLRNLISNWKGDKPPPELTVKDPKKKPVRRRPPGG